MSNTYFRFKQFTIQQEKCAMKVGTDGVLLGAWADISNTNSILDIGTGTGLIALMLAQRSDALITGIDIDESAAGQAAENKNNSPWKDRIKIEHISLQEYCLTKSYGYDLIVSNPPYFQNSLKSPDQSRSMARHGDTMSYTDLISAGKSLLKPNGRLSVIIPSIYSDEFIKEANEAGLFCRRKTRVCSRAELPEKRQLLEFSPKKEAVKENVLVIETDIRHQYTDEFNLLTRDFYLDK
jgi:tRNA1Val (adenine37-N6)-methyltransferase